MRLACTALGALLLALLPHTSISQGLVSQHQRCISLSALADFEPCWTALVGDPSAMQPLVGFISGVLMSANSDDGAAALAAALRVLDAALEKHPGNANLWFTRANALRAAGRLSEALQSYERAVGALPVHVDALHSAAALLAESGPRPRDARLAARLLATAVRVQPSAARLLASAGIILSRLGRDSDVRILHPE